MKSFLKSLKPFLSKNKGIVVISLVYLLTFVLMLPLRNVSYSDDFAYVQTVGKFVKTGNLVITDWTSSAIVFPVVLGAVLSKIFGYSIHLLHLENVIYFLFALYAFYLLLRELKVDNRKSTIFTLILLSYPWIFSFLYSFMSDVFYLSSMIIAVFFYAKGFTKNKLIFYFLGSVFSGFAFLTRQIGVVIPVVAVLILIIKFLDNKKFSLSTLAVSIIPAAAAIIWFYAWTAKTGMTVGYYAFFEFYPKTQIIPLLIPNFSRLGSSNVLYQDIFLGRPVSYIISFMGFLLPAFLIFKFDIKRIAKLVFRNAPYIFLVSLVVWLYSFLIGFDKIEVLKPPTGQVLSTDFLVGNWTVLWPALFYISLPFWIVFTSETLRRIHEALKRKAKVIPWVIVAEVAAFLVFLTLLHLNSTKSILPDLYRNMYSNDPLSLLFGIMNKPYFALTLKEAWMVLIIMSFLFLVAVYVINFVDIKKIARINKPILLILLVFLSHFLITNIFGYTTWEEYTIPWIPLILLGVAYATAKVPSSKLLPAIVVFILVFFSLQLTRSRYQEQGSRWEVGQKLVDSGVEPRRVLDQNWPWRPYWYWEPEFNEMVRTKYGGDKYKVPPSAFNPVSPAIPDGYVYRIISTENNKSVSFKGIDAFSYSEPYWIFDKNSPFFIHFKHLGVVKTMYP